MDMERQAGRQPVLFSRVDRVGRVLAAMTRAMANAAAVSSLLTLSEARTLATSHLAATDEVTELSLERFSGLWARFDRFADRVCGVVLIQDIDREIVAAFLRARTTTGSLPAASTVRVRLTALRLLFRVLRQLRLATSDPTLDVELPRRSYPGFRPLVDDEIERCRWAALATTVVTRDPAVWGLAEAGASTGEIGLVRTSDLDVERSRVFVTGGRKGVARWLPLTEWGAAQLVRRARGLDLGAFLTYAGDGSYDSRRSSVTAVVTRVLRRAGLGDAACVEPRSVTAWVGTRVLADTGRIDAVAHRLGLRSLDLAAELIGWDWQLASEIA